VPVWVTPPLLDTHVAVWLVMALPLSAPSTNVTVSEPVLVAVDADTAFTRVGAAGGPPGVTDASLDCGLSPAGLTAETL
jgi:hypothetical protein